MSSKIDDTFKEKFSPNKNRKYSASGHVTPSINIPITILGRGHFFGEDEILERLKHREYSV